MLRKRLIKVSELAHPGWEAVEGSTSVPEKMNFATGAEEEPGFTPRLLHQDPSVRVSQSGEKKGGRKDASQFPGILLTPRLGLEFMMGGSWVRSLRVIISFYRRSPGRLLSPGH